MRLAPVITNCNAPDMDSKVLIGRALANRGISSTHYVNQAYWQACDDELPRILVFPCKVEGREGWGTAVYVVEARRIPSGYLSMGFHEWGWHILERHILHDDSPFLHQCHIGEITQELLDKYNLATWEVSDNADVD